MKLQLCQSVHRGYCMTPGDCWIKINFPAHIYFMCNLLRIIYMTALVRVDIYVSAFLNAVSTHGRII